LAKYLILSKKLDKHVYSIVHSKHYSIFTTKRIGDEALRKIKWGYLSGSTGKTRRDTERHLKISIEGQGMKVSLPSFHPRYPTLLIFQSLKYVPTSPISYLDWPKSGLAFVSECDA
jgi:hypothetical protein